jgi:hypothetical protein
MHTISPANSTARPEGVERLKGGLLAAQPAQQPLPVPRDDEQGVVDPDPEPDQQRELVGERRHVHHVREQADDRDAGPQRESRGEEREQGRQQRSEHEEQHDRRGDEADAEARRAVAARPRAGDLALDLELDTAARARRDLGDECLGRRILDLVGLEIEGDIGEGDPAGGSDLARATWTVRRRDEGDVRLLGGDGQDLLHLGADRRVGDASLLDRDDDLVGVARGLRRVALEQGDGVEALRAGELEVVRVRASRRRVNRR